MSETAERISTTLETIFQRSYATEAPDLRRLYENAKRDQWNAARDIDWSQDVDLDRGIFANELVDGHGTDTLNRLDPRRLPSSTWNSHAGGSPSSSTARRARCLPAGSSSTWCRATTPSSFRPPR